MQLHIVIFLSLGFITYTKWTFAILPLWVLTSADLSVSMEAADCVSSPSAISLVLLGKWGRTVSVFFLQQMIDMFSYDSPNFKGC